MAVEPLRECGYRQVGGLYLVSEGMAMVCDRIPVPIVPCGVCGELPRFTRGVARIRPYALWGQHASCADMAREFVDPLCDPPDAGFLMWVGSDYTAESFRLEAARLGVSKRISQVPEDLRLGVDWVFLAKQRIIPQLTGELEERRRYGPGVFFVFRPARIEKIVTDLTDPGELAELRRQGIEPVIVPHGDPDHRARRSRSGGSPRSSGDEELEAAPGRVGPAGDWETSGVDEL